MFISSLLKLQNKRWKNKTDAHCDSENEMTQFTQGRSFSKFESSGLGLQNTGFLSCGTSIGTDSAVPCCAQ